MNLEKLLSEKILLTVINKTTCDTSTSDQIKISTLTYWKMNLKKAKDVDYVIGIRHGIAISCYRVDGIELRKEDGRVGFKFCEDLSHIVNGVNLKEMGVRKGHKEIQYINIK